MNAPIEQTKKCTKCAEVKLLTEYYLSKGKPNSYCRTCGRAMCKAYKAKNKKKLVSIIMNIKVTIKMR